MPLRKCCLRQSDGDAAVGDVAGRVNQLPVGQHAEQSVQVGFGIQIERRGRAPQRAQNGLGVFRRAEDSVCSRRDSR